MTNPDNAASQTKEGHNAEPATFADKVNVVVQGMIKKDDGTWTLPEGEHSEEVQFAAMAEKRRRDTQSSYVKTKQTLAQTTSERDAFKSKLATKATITLTADQRRELNDLKVSDPDAWKDKLDGYDAEAQTLLDTEMEETSIEAKKNSVVASRQVILDAYIEANPGFSLNDDILANDVPPRISNKLASGEIQFEDFLGEVHTYLKSTKVLATSEETEQLNLGDIAGGSTPSQKAQSGDLAENYAKTDIF